MADKLEPMRFGTAIGEWQSTQNGLVQITAENQQQFLPFIPDDGDQDEWEEPLPGTEYTIASVIEVILLQLENMDGQAVANLTFSDGARWALEELRGRCDRADQLHRIMNAKPR